MHLLHLVWHRHCRVVVSLWCWCLVFRHVNVGGLPSFFFRLFAWFRSLAQAMKIVFNNIIETSLIQADTEMKVHPAMCSVTRGFSRNYWHVVAPVVDPSASLELSTYCSSCSLLRFGSCWPSTTLASFGAQWGWWLAFPFCQFWSLYGCGVGSCFHTQFHRLVVLAM